MANPYQQLPNQQQQVYPNMNQPPPQYQPPVQGQGGVVYPQVVQQPQVVVVIPQGFYPIFIF